MTAPGGSFRHLGELWIDGEKVAEVSACQAKVALNKETVNLCGRFMTTHKAMNASGTGSLTLHKVDSGFARGWRASSAAWTGASR